MRLDRLAEMILKPMGWALMSLALLNASLFAVEALAASLILPLRMAVMLPAT